MELKTDNEKRLNELLVNCVDYIYNLKEKESAKEQNDFWRNIIGFTDEELGNRGMLLDEVEE